MIVRAAECRLPSDNLMLMTEGMMENRSFGKTGRQVSLLGFGGAEIGYSGISEEDAARLLNEAVDAGLNVVDTAAAYGASEELIGKVLSQRRSEFLLLTKCGLELGYREDWRPENLLASVERSLRALRTDVLDVVQLHSCSLDVLKEGAVIDALETARARGLTRWIGYSGDGAAAAYAVECGRFDTLQTSLNVADQESATLTIPKAAGRGMGVIIKRPLANAAWYGGTRPENAYHHAYYDRLVKLAYPWAVAGDRNSIGTALRFTATVPGVSTMIVGTTRPGRWAENAAILEQGPLPEAEFEAIRQRWAEVAGADWVGLQ